MAHIVESAGGANAPETAQEMASCSLSRSTALVAPNEEQFDEITDLIKNLIEEGRGECIFDVGMPGHEDEDPEASTGLTEVINSL